MTITLMIRVTFLCIAWAVPASAGELLPPNQSPVDPAAAKLLALDPLTKKAIAMFNASESSNRHYDLVECLDGLTFGFGNEPQSNLRDVMTHLSTESGGATFKIFAARMTEGFAADAAAWAAFVKVAGIPATDRSETAVAAGLRRTLLDRTFMAPYAKAFPVHQVSQDRCIPKGAAPGIRSFYDDHHAWFASPARLALRDLDLVDFQVRDWRRRYLDRGVAAATKLGISGDPGSILLTFVMSNPGQVPRPARDALVAGRPPATLDIAGRAWRWDGTDRPAPLARAPLDRWQMLLVWQVMCSGRDRIRNRNIAFFGEYLTDTFVLPAMHGRTPRDYPDLNCNPATVTPAPAG